MTDTPDIVQQVSRAIAPSAWELIVDDVQGGIRQLEARRASAAHAEYILALVHSLLAEPTQEMSEAGSTARIGVRVTLWEALDDEGMTRAFRGEQEAKEYGQQAAQRVWRAMLAASSLTKVLKK